jgi:hypothetical protein
VSYELTEKAEVRISIYSIYGNELKNFVNTVQDHGLYTRIIYPREQGIKPGIYLLRLQVDNVPSIKRIIIQ